MVALNKETAAVYLLDDDTSILKATRRLSIRWLEGGSLQPIRSHFY